MKLALAAIQTHHSSHFTSSLPLKRHIDDIGERCVAVKDVDVEPFVLERAHRIQPFLLTRATAAHPDLDALELALGLRLAESIDDAAAAGWKHGCVPAWNFDKFDRAFDL